MSEPTAFRDALEFTRREEYPGWLCSVFDGLAGDELDVIGLVVEGLLRGKADYDQLDVATDRRDFAANAVEEVRDQITYDCADLLRRLRRAGG